MDARVGDLVEPVTELPVEVIEVTEAAAEEKVLTDVTERALDLAFCLCPIGPTRLREVAVVAGEFQQSHLDVVSRIDLEEAELSVVFDGREVAFLLPTVGNPTSSCC